MSFVDELKIYAKAGDGGKGVVRWSQEKYKPMAGPAGGNGGDGGSVFVRAVRDLNLLSKYTGKKSFIAKDGEAGRGSSQYGKGSNDLYIDVPVGSTVTNLATGRSIDLLVENQVEKILKGGNGGLGNEHFKSSTNQSPVQSTEGKPGESGEFFIELALSVDVGLIGLPNAGKSTLLNLLTNAKSQVGSYQFTTLEPHIGMFYGYSIADIPGLIEGAADGKGLGHKFLRHITRTKMLLHLISLDQSDPEGAYYTISKELSNFSLELNNKPAWIVFTKKDLVKPDDIQSLVKFIDKNENDVFVISENDPDSIKSLADTLVAELRRG